MTRTVHEWTRECTLNLADQTSRTGVATVCEVAFDESFTAWFGRIKLRDSDLVAIGRVPLTGGFGVFFTDGRGGHAEIAFMTHVDAIDQREYDVLPAAIKATMRAPPPKAECGTFIYFSGTSRLEKKAKQ
jgi:hypothetical protein